MLEESNELDEVLKNASNKKIDSEKINSILNKIDEENSKLASNNQEMLDGITPPKRKKIEVEQSDEKEEEEEEEENDDNDKDNDSKDNNKNNGDNNKNKENKGKSNKKIEIDYEQYSIVNNTKNCFIKLFSCLLPYKDNLKIIKIHYNTTILLLFKIYRFLVLMSFFSLIIFFFECIFHIVKKKDNFTETCKYFLPCFLQYSSFDLSEAQVFSITYGVWLIFFSICSIAYYYVLSSDQEQQNIYFENNINTVGCRYLTTSWNFNYRNEEISKKCKNAIKEELKLYAQKFTDLLPKENNKNDDECNYGFYGRIFLQVIYLGFIVIYFALFLLVFCIRDVIRNKSKALNAMEAMDIIADIISFLFIAIILRLFNKLTEIFPSFEGWEKSSHKYLSTFIKKIITTFVGFFALLFVFTYFTLYPNSLGEKMSLFGTTQATFFGCPGKYEDHRHTYHSFPMNTLEENYQEAKTSSYSKCREEELGFDFLFIFLFYFILTFLIDLFKMCCTCCCDIQESFDPIKSMINVFSNIILYSIAMFYIPYLGLLFPLITILIYKFQFYLLKHQKSYTFNESGLIKRNNTKYLRIISLIFILGLIVIQGYLYLLSYPHYYKVNCYAPNEGVGDSSVLLYNYKKEWCGPVRSFERVSDVFTNAVSDSPFLGEISSILQEMPFLIVILALVCIVLIYKNNYLDSRYNEYLKKKQKELDNTFRVYYGQISRRDLLTSMLLKVTKLKV